MMPAKKYHVNLNLEERDELKQLINTGKVAALKRKLEEVLGMDESSKQQMIELNHYGLKSIGCFCG